MFNFLLAQATDLYGVANGMNDLMKKILGPVLTVVGVMAIVYAIYLGVMYAKAEDANKRKEVQGRLIGACIGATIIIVVVTLCFSIDWADVYWTIANRNCAKLLHPRRSRID